MLSDLLLSHLSGDFTQITPVEIGPRLVTITRHQLTQLGFELSYNENIAADLSEKQFRGIRSPRGEAVCSLLHANKHIAVRRMTAIWNHTIEIADKFGGHRIVSSKTNEPIDGTQNRGLMQALADILAIIYMPEDQREEFHLRLNRRIWRGARLLCENDEQRTIVDQNFAGYGDIPTAKTASVHPGALEPVWLYLIAYADATQ